MITMHQNSVCKGGYNSLRNKCPQFAGQVEAADAGTDVFTASGFAGQRGDEIAVHRHLSAVCVQMALGQLDGLAYHDAQCDAGYAEVVGQLQRLADEVAVVHEGLWRQVGVVGTDEAFALGTGVDDDTRAARGTSHIHGLGDGVDEGFCREWFHDARSTDDGDAAHDAQARVESASGYFFTLGDGEDDFGPDGMLGLFGQGGEQVTDAGSYHAAWRGVDGCLAHGGIQSGQGDTAHARPAVDVDGQGVGGVRLVRKMQHDAGFYRQAVGDVGVVARILDNAGRGADGLSVGRDGAAARAGGDGEYLAVGQHHRKFVGPSLVAVVQGFPCGGYGSGGGAGTGRQSRVLRIEVGQQLFHLPAESVPACHGDEGGWKRRSAQGQCPDAERGGRFNLFFKSSRQSAFFQQDNVWTEVFQQLPFVFAFVVVQEAFAGKSLTVG